MSTSNHTPITAAARKAVRSFGASRSTCIASSESSRSGSASVDRVERKLSKSSCRNNGLPPARSMMRRRSCGNSVTSSSPVARNNDDASSGLSAPSLISPTHGSSLGSASSPSGRLVVTSSHGRVRAAVATRARSAFDGSSAACTSSKISAVGVVTRASRSAIVDSSRRSRRYRRSRRSTAGVVGVGTSSNAPNSGIQSRSSGAHAATASWSVRATVAASASGSTSSSARTRWRNGRYGAASPKVSATDRRVSSDHRAAASVTSRDLPRPGSATMSTT